MVDREQFILEFSTQDKGAQAFLRRINKEFDDLQKQNPELDVKLKPLKPKPKDVPTPDPVEVKVIPQLEGGLAAFASQGRAFEVLGAELGSRMAGPAGERLGEGIGQRLEQIVTGTQVFENIGGIIGASMGGPIGAAIGQALGTLADFSIAELLDAREALRDIRLIRLELAGATAEAEELRNKPGFFGRAKQEIEDVSSILSQLAEQSPFLNSDFAQGFGRGLAQGSSALSDLLTQIARDSGREILTREDIERIRALGKEFTQYQSAVRASAQTLERQFNPQLEAQERLLEGQRALTRGLISDQTFGALFKDVRDDLIEAEKAAKGVNQAVRGPGSALELGTAQEASFRLSSERTEQAQLEMVALQKEANQLAKQLLERVTQQEQREFERFEEVAIQE